MSTTPQQLFQFRVQSDGTFTLTGKINDPNLLDRLSGLFNEISLLEEPNSKADTHKMPDDMVDTSVVLLKDELDISSVQSDYINDSSLMERGYDTQEYILEGDSGLLSLIPTDESDMEIEYLLDANDDDVI